MPIHNIRLMKIKLKISNRQVRKADLHRENRARNSEEFLHNIMILGYGSVSLIPYTYHSKNLFNGKNINPE